MCVRTGHSLASDPREAVDALHRAIAQPGMSLVMVFCSSRFDLDALAAALNERFAGIPVIGCTTAGEIGPAGCRDGGLVGVSFAASAFVAASGRIDRVAQFAPDSAPALAHALGRQVPADAGHGFAVLLVDGLCGHEELIAHELQAALGDIPLVGASAGDDQAFAATRVFVDGAFRTDTAVLAVLRTRLPFKVFRNHHFAGGAEALVVTDADPHRRIVYGINGRPAAAEYARAAGVRDTALTAAHFASAPMVVRINGNDYVRSIRQVNPDGSLTLFCAIDRGVVLHVARDIDLAHSRSELFEDLHQAIGQPLAVLGFDCIHCRLEARADGSMSQLEQAFVANRVVGFSSYGEQFLGIHVNQTFTGVAIGGVEDSDHEH